MNKYKITSEEGLWVARRLRDNEKLGYVISSDPKDRERLAEQVEKHGWERAADEQTA